MTIKKLIFTLWDVGHGLSIWIKTPSGENHWIDLGKSIDFSPSEHVSRCYGVSRINYLIISHPDKDHLEDLPQFKKVFGVPKTLLRNMTLPEVDMFGERKYQYQIDFANIHKRYNANVSWDESPKNPDRNGGVEYVSGSLDHGPLKNGSTLLGSHFIKGNNTSIVVMLLYNGVLFVCPGDIEPLGWQELWKQKHETFRGLINRARIRLLVAPHHGRGSGYSKEMMDCINPHAVFISDVWGASETHSAYYREPLGIQTQFGLNKYYSSKRGGRIQVEVPAIGEFSIDQYSK